MAVSGWIAVTAYSEGPFVPASVVIQKDYTTDDASSAGLDLG